MQPTRSMLHVDQVLTDLSVAYIQSQDEFVADKVFPTVTVRKQSDRYIVYAKDDWFRTDAARRAPASESVGTGFKIDNTPTYFCQDWALHKDVPWDDYDNADAPIDVEGDSQALVTRQILLRRELTFNQQYMAPNVWQGYADPATGNYSDFVPSAGAGSGSWGLSTSNPPKDIDLLKSMVESQTGFTPNTLVLSKNVYYTLRNHAAMVGRLKITDTQVLEKDDMARIFGVDNLLVSGAVLNRAQEGQPAMMNYISNNSALLCYAAPSPSLRQPSAGYIFSWVGKAGAGVEGNVVRKIDMPLKKATRIESEISFDMKQVGKDLGVFLSNVVS